jgi:glyoxylase-like metal-dependent hydrolase (beta-lactamase superfamily II)
MADSWQVTKHVASNGNEIYRVPLEVFPRYYAHAYVILSGEHRILVDTGSGLPASDQRLITGFGAIHEQFGAVIEVESLTMILITHGHIDHIGGVDAIGRLAPKAQIAIHELDMAALIHPLERKGVARQRMGRFLRQAGVPYEKYKQLLSLYVIGKLDSAPVPVDVVLHDGDVIAEGLEVIHVPGHSPGLVMLRAGDTLLTSDHILPKTSVALSPESIMPYEGVGHYLDSLQKAARLNGIQLAMGGHEDSMADYYEALERTVVLAVSKIQRIHDACTEPATIYDLASKTYGVMEGYTELLMVEQVGARVEYLSQRGQLVIDNLDEVLADEDRVVVYRRS